MDASLASGDRITKVADQKLLIIDKKVEELTVLKNLLRNSVDNCNNSGINKNDETNCPLFDL